MRINTSSIRKAEILLNMIIEELEGIEDESCSACVSTYQNGRESGYTVSVGYPVNVTFSENRNSDQIVVYLNNDSNQGLSEEAWKSAKYFKYNDYKGACNYCVSELLRFRVKLNDVENATKSRRMIQA